MTGLASFACDPLVSRGRRFVQAVDATRNEYQRDRDRIIHSTAFRRLVYKTQVFLNHEGDLFRTRLTHSLEVAQLARSIARALGLHEDLTEAIALAHDLGHTPFGHAGQDALDGCAKAADPEGRGFEHNFQSLRVVDVLERCYPAFDGLNLCFETREGILKHCSVARARELEEAEPDGVGARFLARRQPNLEAQVCNLADEIAYNTHDIDDGLRAGLLDEEQLMTLTLWREHRAASLAEHPGIEPRRLRYATLRRLMSAQVHDVIASTRQRIGEYGPQTVEDVRHSPAMVCVSETLGADVRPMKALLRSALYRHPQVVEQTDMAKQVVRDLYAAYRSDPREMPPDHAEREPVHEAVADYIAGMTDRFALREHQRLFPGAQRPNAVLPAATG